MKSKPTLRQSIVLSMIGAMMFASTFAMKGLPNIHLLAFFIIVSTRVYRAGALIPIYIYVIGEGVYEGFGLFWLPNLYIWTVLWVLVMLLPEKLPKKLEPIIYCLFGGLHGIAFGALWAPANALLMHLNFSQSVAWVIAGLPFDALHAAGNIVSCLLCVPVIALMKRLEQKSVR